MGEIAAAVVAIKPYADVSEEELKEFAKGLPRYKRPRKYIFDEVPRNQTGKIEKPLLRERYGVAHLVEEQTER